MANHEHPCKYCHEDMRLMWSDSNHEQRCPARAKHTDTCAIHKLAGRCDCKAAP